MSKGRYLLNGFIGHGINGTSAIWFEAYKVTEPDNNECKPFTPETSVKMTGRFLDLFKNEEKTIIVPINNILLKIKTDE